MDHGDHDRIGLERALDDAMHGLCLRASQETRQRTRYDAARFAYRYHAPRTANGIAALAAASSHTPKMLPPDPMTPR